MFTNNEENEAGLATVSGHAETFCKLTLALWAAFHFEMPLHNFVVFELYYLSEILM